MCDEDLQSCLQRSCSSRLTNKNARGKAKTFPFSMSNLNSTQLFIPIYLSNVTSWSMLDPGWAPCPLLLQAGRWPFTCHRPGRVISLATVPRDVHQPHLCRPASHNPTSPVLLTQSCTTEHCGAQQAHHSQVPIAHSIRHHAAFLVCCLLALVIV